VVRVRYRTVWSDKIVLRTRLPILAVRYLVLTEHHVHRVQNIRATFIVVEVNPDLPQITSENHYILARRNAARSNFYMR